jgi:HlyD family secretion protein
MTPRGTPWAGLGLILATMASCRNSDPPGIVGRGTVELPEIDLALPVAARVVAVRVDEGADVAAGDTVALFAQTDLPSAVAVARARVAAAAAGLRDLEVGARPEEIQRAEAELAAASAEAARTAADLERFRSLFSRDVIARQQLDNATTAATIAAERKRAAAEQLAMLRAGTRRDRIDVARGELASARASLGMIEARAADLVLLAPVAGRVLTRQAEPGEQLAPGTPAVTLGDLSRPFVRVYLPASQVAGLKVGDEATLTVEGSDQSPGTARVVAISTKAEFTPRVALTEQERADLMFGVKLEIQGSALAIHPGLWVTATFGVGRATGAASTP